MTILEIFLKNKGVQKTLKTRPGEEGFSLVELVVVIAVLAILSAVAIPAFVGVQANARASAVKNALVNGVKECVVRAADNKSTDWAEAQSFATPGAYQGYVLEEGADDTCYSALADASSDTVDSDFSIAMDPGTGVVLKTCSNVNLPGCDGSEVDVPDGAGGTTTSTAGNW